MVVRLVLLGLLSFVDVSTSDDATNFLMGRWDGTEACIDHCCTEGGCQGTVPSSLEINMNGTGFYIVGGGLESSFRPSTFTGDFSAGALIDRNTNSTHGQYIIEANATDAWGSWISFGSKRQFHWNYKRSKVPPSGSNFELVEVFGEGMYGYSCHRVPAFVVANDELLIFVESRRPSCSDQAPKDINLRRSRDGGYTWEDPIRVIGDTILTNDSITYRNPYPTVCKGCGPSSEDMVILNFVNSTNNDAGAAWPSIQMTSINGGVTWSKPEVVVPGLDPSSIEGVLGGPGYGIELGRHSSVQKHKGRLVSCGATGYHAGVKMNAVVWYSDNKGSSWNVTSTPLANMQECQVVELTNGSLLMNMRNAHLNPCDCRAMSISNDGGATWSQVTYVEDLIEPVVSAGFINTGISTDELYFSNPATKTHRTNMTIKYSKDSGATWTSGTVVWPQAAAYSVLNEVNSTHLGLVFEHGTASAYEMISLAFVPKSKVV